MKTKVQMWGNGLALRIPKFLVDEALLEPGTEIDLILNEGKLVITHIVETVDTLEQLLESITDENIHSEISF